MVPLVTTMKPKSSVPEDKFAPFIFKDSKKTPLVTDELRRVWVTKDQASMLKELSEGFDGRLPKDLLESQSLWQDYARTFSGIQGYLKKGKTVYNPNAHARNALGAIQYTIGSGNYMGLIDGLSLLVNPTRRREISDTLR